MPDIANKRVLVTGAAGFIGTRLLARLVGDGARVFALDRVPVANTQIERAFCGDIADANALRTAVRESAPDVVFHLAASLVRSSELLAFRHAIEANLLVTLSLVEAMQAECVDARLVAMGTSEEYGTAPCPFDEGERESPVSTYSLSKLAMTRMLETLSRVQGLPVTIIRPSLAYGPGQRPNMFVPALIAAILEGREFPTTPGEQTRDFVYVDDLVDALVRASVSDAALGRVINIGSGDAVRICDLATTVERLAGVSGLVKLGAMPYRAGEQMEYSVDSSLARELIGWSATTPLEEGLRRTIDAARSGA